jgi:TonB family protein
MEPPADVPKKEPVTLDVELVDRSESTVGSKSPERIYSVEGPVKAPVVISRPRIDYSECDLGGKRLSGTPMAEAVIDTRGAVSHAKLVKGVEPCLDRQFLAALHEWKFKPATLDGKPVSVRMNFTLNIHYR